MYEYNFLKALVLTVTIEIFVVLVYYRLRKSDFTSIDGGLKKLLPIVALASIMTLPYIWFILPVFIRHKLAYIIIAEFSVILFEMLFYYTILACNVGTAFRISLMANFVSFLFGKIITAIEKLL